MFLEWYNFFFFNLFINFCLKKNINTLFICDLTLILKLFPYELILSLSFFLISIGLWSSCINKNNLFKVILSLEVIYLGIIFFFIVIGLLTLQIKCFLITLIIFSTAAAETAVLLSLLINLFTFNYTITFSSLNNLS